jgi:hypothetical protein
MSTYTAADILARYGLPAASLIDAMAEGLPLPFGVNTAGGDLWDTDPVDRAVRDLKQAPFSVVGKRTCATTQATSLTP